MNKNRQLTINLIASFTAYIITFGTNFFLSPYIVKNIGVEAYGFVGLANNFISYAGLITIALNSLAGRFVTIKICRKDIDGANAYFSSVFIANLVIAAFMSILSILVLVFLDRLINIPNEIFWDVEVLFASLFINCLIGTVGSVFSVSTFATNKLYLNSVRQIESNTMRAILIITLFVLLKPRVAYLGITSMLCGVYIFAFNIHYTKKLLPEIRIKKSHFQWRAIVTLISSGIWNLVTRLGELLSTSLDLLITNLFIDSTAMGVLSLAKTVPNIIAAIIGSMVGVFSPNFTRLYAEQKIDELVKAVKQSMRIMGMLSNIPIIILIVCGELFFSLWQPTQDSHALQILSILTCASFILSGGINCIFNIFTVVNKLKLNALVICLSGMLNIIVVFALLKSTDLGIYAIAGVSTIIAIIKNLLFTIPYSAKCLGLKWNAFYMDAFKPVMLTGISCILGYALTCFFEFKGWLGLIECSVIICVISVVIGFFLILNRSDRIYLIEIFKRKVQRT